MLSSLQPNGGLSLSTPPTTSICHCQSKHTRSCFSKRSMWIPTFHPHPRHPSEHANPIHRLTLFRPSKLQHIRHCNPQRPAKSPKHPHQSTWSLPHPGALPVALPRTCSMPTTAFRRLHAPPIPKSSPRHGLFRTDRLPRSADLSPASSTPTKPSPCTSKAASSLRLTNSKLSLRQTRSPLWSRQLHLVHHLLRPHPPWNTSNM
jgi:hypothetical protein